MVGRVDATAGGPVLWHAQPIASLAVYVYI